jgi:hypothetical protein
MQALKASELARKTAERELHMLRATADSHAASGIFRDHEAPKTLILSNSSRNTRRPATCSASSLRCSRRRLRTCESSGIGCAGYAVQDRWGEVHPVHKTGTQNKCFMPQNTYF